VKSTKLRVFLLAVSVALAVGCGPTPSRLPVPTPNRALGAGETWLPVATKLFDGTALCGGGGFVEDIRLRGSADDPRLAWLVFPGGSRREVSWRPGYSARFTPLIEVLDGRGDVVARDGSQALGGCGDSGGAILVESWR
jgi:hypothetical protein